MTCRYKNHRVATGETYHYEDTVYGPFNGTICRRCLYEHLKKYRPDSPNMRHLLAKFPELAAANETNRR